MVARPTSKVRAGPARSRTPPGAGGRSCTNEATEVEEQCQEDDGIRAEAWDDVHMCRLDPNQDRESRKIEMEYFRKDLTRKLPTKVRWVDTNKQDEANPKYRSILFAKGFKRWADPQTYMARPPIGALRLIKHVAAAGQSIRGDRTRIMMNDVARAYTDAASLTPTFVEIRDGHLEEGDE